MSDFDDGVEACKNYVLDYLSSLYDLDITQDVRLVIDDLLDHFENALDSEIL